jgi:FMN phosphatase YigB (HAD superfamily)
VTIKAVVSDAYGTLYDIQSVAAVTEEAFPGEAMALACVKNELVAPLTTFKAIQMQMDEFGLDPDYRIHALSELPDLIAAP